jgi:phytoene synthase
MQHSDAAHCRQIVRRHARTFWLASHFLPEAKRRAAFALYAFCRVADDMVDEGAAGRLANVSEQLARYREQLDRALAGLPDGPVFRELASAATHHEVPPAVLHELLDGVARDCAPVRYESWSELATYCGGVASSVGEMCTYVFGVEAGVERDRALRHARTLGVAMQLTNILRDVGEDARIGRCYLPTEDLAEFGLTRADVLAGRVASDPRWTSFMTFEIARARALYVDAFPGIGLLAADSRRCALACAVGYAGILGAIEQNGYDTFATRARLGTVARAGVLWSTWRGVPLVAPPSQSPRDGEIMRWA